MPNPAIAAAVLLGASIMTFLYFMYKGNAQQHENYEYGHARRTSEPRTAWHDDYNNYPRLRRESNAEECSICLNTNTSTERTQLPCGHYFHDECIRKWRHVGAKGSALCPNCRHGYTGRI